MGTIETSADRRRVVSRRPMYVRRLVDPVHLLAIGFGSVLFVLGLVALVRTGLPTGSWTSPTVTVGWLTHTPLLAVFHLLGGAMLVSAGAAPALDRSAEMSLAIFAGLIGVVLLIEPTAFQGALSTGRDHGLTYLVGGAALLIASAVAPIWETNRTR